MEVKFKFALGQKVKHKDFPTIVGVVNGLMTYSQNVARIGISYVDGTGKLVEDWFDEAQFEAV